jgi:hypothetical protein
METYLCGSGVRCTGKAEWTNGCSATGYVVIAIMGSSQGCPLHLILGCTNDIVKQLHPCLQRGKMHC